MDIAYLCGRQDKELMEFGDAYFIDIINMLRYNDIYKHFTTHGSRKFFMLNNGHYRSTPINTTMLLKVASETFVDEIVAPDVPFNCNKTLELTFKFAKDLHNEQFEVMGVPQGNTIMEYEQCFTAMLDNDDIHSIGISNITTTRHFTNSNGMSPRTYCINFLAGKYHLTDYKKPLHLLGCTEPVELMELRYYKLDNLVRSINTNSPFDLGYNDILFSEDGFKPPNSVLNILDQDTYEPTIEHKYHTLCNMFHMYQAAHN